LFCKLQEEAFFSCKVLAETEFKNLILDHPTCPSNSEIRFESFSVLQQHISDTPELSIVGPVGYKLISYQKTIPDYSSNVISRLMNNDDVKEILINTTSNL